MRRGYRAAAAVALAAFGVVLTTPNAASAQAGGRAAILLELPAGARSAALGGAYSAADDADALFSNPAQVDAAADRAGRVAAAASFGRYLQQSALVAASATLRAWAGSVGVGVRALDYASEPEVECADPPLCTLGRETGRQVGANDLAMTAAYAAGSARLRAGGSVTLVQQSVAGVSGRALSLDVGASGLVAPGTTIAVATQQPVGEMRTGSRSAPLPRAIRVGVAHEREVAAALGLTIVGEIRRQSGAVGVTPAGGAELRWLGAASPFDLAARVGAAARSRGGDAQPLSVGGSVVYNATPVAGGALREREQRVAVDYAFQSFRDLGGVHRVGVRWWR
ncbi:MAG TPA: hypothetical protein VKA84_24690 [Gemmatimonadaceae bacterium]|nr:hypothetical protein [Gemmatimonadaceae bacterium]